MVNRIAGFGIVLFWLGSMAWLVSHDVWPALIAQEVPALKATEWLKTGGKASQAGIFDKSGRIGTIFTIYRIDEESIQREDTVTIDRFSVPIAPLHLTVDSSFTAAGVLDELTVNLTARDVSLKLHGERFHSDFSFQLQSGPMDRTFKIPLSEAGMISGGIKPFANLTDLRVGQTWRMQVFNPVAAVTGVGSRFIPMLVRVAGTEMIETDDGPRSCFIVESANARAWVDKRGEVRRQEVTLPVGGVISFVPEPFDTDQSERARKAYAEARASSGRS